MKTLLRVGVKVDRVEINQADVDADGVPDDQEVDQTVDLDQDEHVVDLLRCREADVRRIDGEQQVGFDVLPSPG